MFTGIIEETGTVQSITRHGSSIALCIAADKVTEGTAVGDSIAVNGVCLTVTSLNGKKFTADVMPETVHRTSLSKLAAGSKVNLERALRASDRLGGHIVSGHVDGCGVVESTVRDGIATRVAVKLPESLLRYIAVASPSMLEFVAIITSFISSS